VSWFGFNNAQGGPDGLWAGGSEAATDFGAIAYQLKLLGELQAVEFYFSPWCCTLESCKLQTC
jgi:hypothetical protein